MEAPWWKADRVHKTVSMRSPWRVSTIYVLAIMEIGAEVPYLFNTLSRSDSMVADIHKY